jgi:hypothetical protein
MPRPAIDIQGDSRPIYGPVRTVQLRWALTTYEEWASMQDLFDLVQSTGTVVVQLPAFPTITGSAMSYSEYSGCILGEPQVGQFFAESYPESVVLVITNIITD